MGYRSDVRIITSKKGFEELNKYVKNYLSKTNESNYNLMDDLKFKVENKYSCYFGWNWVKWYENSYSAVDAVMSGLEHLREKDLSFRYSRIGENYDDYDEYNYDSEKDELDIYPVMLRQFDDDYVEEQLKKNDEYFRNLKDRKKKDGKELLQN